jgi:nucleoside-diphosphate-sugar epimerase
MRVLVTGSSGFIGRHLVDKLENEDLEIIATPLRSEGFDITNRQDVLNLPAADLVIHLAAIANVPDSWDPTKGIELWNTNTVGTLNILGFCEKHSARLVFPSSYLYGNPQYLPVDENHPVSTPNPYAVSKLAAESLCFAYHEKNHLPTTILRVFNCYGPGQSQKMVISQMIAELRDTGNITLFSGLPQRDFVYVEDVVDAFLLASKQERDSCDVYNVGSGESHSIFQIAQMLMEISGSRGEIIDKDIQRANEILNTVADTRKIQQELGWTCSTSIQRGLEATYESELRRGIETEIQPGKERR